MVTASVQDFNQTPCNQITDDQLRNWFKEEGEKEK